MTTDQQTKDVDAALKFLRGQLKDKEEEPKTRQMAARSILNYYREKEASAGKKAQQRAEASVISAAGRFKRAQAPG